MTARLSFPLHVLVSRTRHVVREGTEALLDYQCADGFWGARVASDPSVTAQYLLTARYLDRLRPDVEGPMLNYLWLTQLPEGGWSAFPGGPASLDVSLACYAALRFAGIPAEHPELTRARRAIITRGGLEGVGFVPRFPLVFWGQVPLDRLTYLSPKILFLPAAFRPNFRELGILMQAVLAVELLLKARAVRTPTAGRDLIELRTGGEFPSLAMSPTGTVLSAASRCVDALIPAPGLDRRAADWLAEQQNADGLWTGMTLLTNRCLMALQAMDGRRYRSAIDSGMAGLNRLQVCEGGIRWQQLARSPVLDTAMAVICLAGTGVPAGHPRLRRAYDWLIAVQARRAGDWEWSAPGLEPGGWSYLPENDRNPDTGTTLHVLEALTLAPPNVPGRDCAIAHGLRWLLGMQNDDGSWGMFTRERPPRLTMICEFARNCAMDTGTPDVTAHVIRALSRVQGVPGLGPGLSDAIMRGRRFLAATQRADGTWTGRWAVNYTYGAAQGLTALAATGDGVHARRAQKFLHTTQHADGGWGESPESYSAGQFLPAPSTVTHTGLALLALLSASPPKDLTLTAGVQFLLDRYPEGGGLWTEGTFCQVALPGRLYFQNALFAGCLALTAVSRYLRAQG